MTAPVAAHAAATFAAPSPLILVASASCASASSTAVQAAQFTTTAGRWPEMAASTASRSVMSRAVRSRATVLAAVSPSSRVRSTPSMPAAPVTSQPSVISRRRPTRSPEALDVASQQRGARLQRLPPRAVGLIPGDRLGQPGLERLDRPVPELGADLRTVDRVAPVVALAIRHVLHHVPAGAAGVEQPLGEFLVAEFGAAADVVDLAGAAAEAHQFDAGHVVVDVQPVTHVQAVAVERDPSTVQQVRDEQR